MKRITGQELFVGMGRIRESYILEAAEENIARLAGKRRRRSVALRTACVAACVCLVLIGVLHAVMSPVSSPDTPGTPDMPALPNTPVEPNAPGIPTTPDKPVTPITPNTPDTPGGIVRDGGFEIAEGVAISYDGTGADGSDTSVEVPATVRTVSKATFTDYAAAPSVTVLTLTSSETKLEEGALGPLTSLESIIVSDGSGRGVDLVHLLNMTVTDIVNNGCSLTYSYTRYGGSPVYSVGGFGGIELEFIPKDRTDYDDLYSPLCGTAKPRVVYVTNDAPQDVTVAPGLYVGMDIAKAAGLGCDFYDIGEDFENGMICMSYDLSGYTVQLRLTDVPREVYKEIFWWSGSGYNGDPDSVDSAVVESYRPRLEEFARSPVGTVFNIEISEKGSTPPWGWLDE